LETPPLPVTPPPCENRWHDTLAESSPPCHVQQYSLQPRVAITTQLTCQARIGELRSPGSADAGRVRCSAWFGGLIYDVPSSAPSGRHFQDDFQFDGRTEWKTRDTKDEARRDGLVAEDISKQLRRRIGDLGVLRELRRRGDVHAEPDDVTHAVQRT